MKPPSGTLLVIDDDLDVATMIRMALSDEGFDVAILTETTPATVRTTVEQLEPACILLDSERAGDYGNSWNVAAWLRHRPRRIPVVMFTASAGASAEARENVSERSRDADFVAVLPKPFDIEDLIRIVRAVLTGGDARQTLGGIDS